MNPLADVVTQSQAVKKVLSHLQVYIQDDYFASVIGTAVRALDSYSLELSMWLGKRPEPLAASNNARSNCVWTSYDKLVDICRLRIDLLAEALREALNTRSRGLPRGLRQQLHYYAHEFVDIKAMLECILANLSEVQANVFGRSREFIHSSHRDTYASA
jgi:hypothetical protein